MEKTDQWVESKIRITNSLKENIAFVLEPWGEIYELPKNVSIEARILDPHNGTHEIQFSSDAITLYCDLGSTVRIYMNGTELGAGIYGRTPVPAHF